MRLKPKNESSKLTREQLAWRCSVMPDPPDARDWIAEAEPPSFALKQKAFFNAAKYRIFNYYQLASHKLRQAHLVNIGPFVATLPVDESWLDVGADGVIVDSGHTEDAAIGGHAVLVAGDNDQTKMFKLNNSWGPAWGAHGFGYFSYHFAEAQLWTAMGTDLVPETT